MTPRQARENVINSFDVSEVFEIIKRESLKGKFRCVFKKGDCLTKPPHPIASDYTNALLALGYKVSGCGPWEIHISWELPNN